MSTPWMENQPEPLRTSHKIGLVLLVTVIIVLGIWVEFRGAYLQRRMTDVGPYFRAAWAVNSGHDIYKITDDRDLHYVYPPLFAILMTPFADPPDGVDRTGYLPYKASVGIWYVLTVVAGIAGIHRLANVIGNRSSSYAASGRRRFSRQWWALRVIPFLILLPAIGRSQMRGQVGLIIGFLLCFALAAVLEGRRFRAGLWLSGAICIKLIPVLLLVFLLWRRDWRMVLGSAAGLFAGLVVVPVIVMGPLKTVGAYESFYRDTLVAGFRGDTGGSLGGELTGITSTDSNSPMVVIHNIIHPEMKRRPKVADPGVRVAHWIIAFVMIAITLLASGWKGKWFAGKVDATLKDAAFMSAFIPLMFVSSPIFHPHYVSMAIPLVIILVGILWERHKYGNMPVEWKAVFCFVAVSHILTSIDRALFFLYLRDFGLVLFSTITLWAASLIMLRQTRVGSFAPAPMRGTDPAEIRSIAVVLPAFNERETIVRSVESIIRFSERNPAYHFIFVDDGSSDGTSEVLRTALQNRKTEKVSFYRQEENKGKGYAIRNGSRMVEADAYCFMDADMAYPPRYLKLIERRLRNADVVIGSRSLSARLMGRTGAVRAFLGTLFNGMVRYFLGLPFQDTQAGLKGLRREAAIKIFGKSHVNGFSFDAELLFLAKKYRFSIDEVEVSDGEDHVYKKGWKLLAMSMFMFREVILIRWRNLTGRYD
ncbi:MAG: DUF2029 domain-containing protein [Nitrospirae bacterium]|nr:DUF2029 domain-containing protein [Nitrospirota bacterium]